MFVGSSFVCVVVGDGVFSVVVVSDGHMIGLG